MKVRWSFKIYHNIRIYLPAIVLIVMIIIVYLSYTYNYIMIIFQSVKGQEGNIIPRWMNMNYLFMLYNSDDSLQTYLQSLLLFKLFPTNYQLVGLCLFGCFNFSIFWMIISMLRTCLMDPGYLPDPSNYESILISKNIDYANDDVLLCANQSMVSLNKNQSSSYLHSFSMISQEQSRANLTRAKRRNNFIQNFGKLILEGPLTAGEFIRFRRKMEVYFLQKNKTTQDTSSNIQNLSLSFTDGTIINFEDIFENFRNIDTSKVNLCPTCLRWKPERTHHCKQCGKCVRKMDHHCPWLGNCIGFRNYKFFCLTILYGITASLLVFFTFWEYIFIINLRYDATLLQCVIPTFAYMCNFTLLCFLLYLFTTNWGLVLENMTTIERADRERFSKGGEAKANFTFEGQMLMYNYYDLGSCRNFIAVFGKNPLLWFLPFNANYKGEGIVFES